MDTMFETNEITRIFNRALSGEYFWAQEAFDHLESLGFEISIDSYMGMKNVDNTYNSENDLSQDFQFQLFEYNGECYCLFQLHNGCDIRGGYTSTQVFKVSDVDYFFVGMRADFYDNSNHEQFDSYYAISEDERYELNEELGCFINKETKEKVYPYSSALGF